MAPMFRAVQHDFFKKWSPEMAYVLGFFAADGAMIKNNRGAHFIEFHNTDKIIIIKIRSALKSDHHVGVRIPGESKPNHEIAYRLQIGSIEMFDDLTQLGFTQNKSSSIKFPLVPVTYVGDFVRGYFDGDGCVYFKKHFVKARNKKRWIFTSRFTSGSKQYLVDLLATLRLNGVEGGFILDKSKQSGHELILSHKDSLALYRLMYNTASVTGLYLPRKYRLFTKAIETLYPNMRA